MPVIAVELPTFQPAMRLIDGITNANPAVVTTSFDHQYITGTIVRLLVPAEWGMIQADQLKGEITVTGDTTFSVKIDSLAFDSFVTPASPQQYAHVVPIGEINEILTAATQNVLPY